MKTKSVFYFVIVAAAVLILTTCFSPWAGDTGNLTIVWGNTSGRWTFDESSFGTLNYIVTLRGPGGTIEETFTGVPSANFNVIPGTWNVTIKGRYYSENLAAWELAVMGIEQIEVNAGQKKSETIVMYNAIEVNSWQDMDNCFGSSGYLFTPVPITGTSEFYGIMVLINEDLVVKSSPGLIDIPANVPVILVVEKDVTISKENDGVLNPFFRLGVVGVTGDTHTLTLGKKGMSGTLTLSGCLPPNSSQNPQAIVVLNGSTDIKLIMNDGVTIKNNKGWSPVCIGVSIYSGIFEMNGGTITGNDIGVGFSVGSTGEFIMNGGTVSGNDGGGNYENGTYP